MPNGSVGNRLHVLQPSTHLEGMHIRQRQIMMLGTGYASTIHAVDHEIRVHVS